MSEPAPEFEWNEWLGSDLNLESGLMLSQQGSAAPGVRAKPLSNSYRLLLTPNPIITLYYSLTPAYLIALLRSV